MPELVLRNVIYGCTLHLMMYRIPVNVYLGDSVERMTSSFTFIKAIAKSYHVLDV